MKMRLYRACLTDEFLFDVATAADMIAEFRMASRPK